MIGNHKVGLENVKEVDRKTFSLLEIVPFFFTYCFKIIPKKQKKQENDESYAVTYSPCSIHKPCFE